MALDGVPSEVWYTAGGRVKPVAETGAAPGVVAAPTLLARGDLPSDVSPLSLSESFVVEGGAGTFAAADDECEWAAEAAFLRFGAGMRHSMLKATQLVQGTPRLAASQRT